MEDIEELAASYERKLIEVSDGCFCNALLPIRFGKSQSVVTVLEGCEYFTVFKYTSQHLNEHIIILGNVLTR